MNKYKIVSSTQAAFNGIELPFNFDGKKVGDDVSLLNDKFKVTQIGVIVNLSNENNAVTLMKV